MHHPDTLRVTKQEAYIHSHSEHYSVSAAGWFKWGIALATDCATDQRLLSCCEGCGGRQQHQRL